MTRHYFLFLGAIIFLFTASSFAQKSTASLSERWTNMLDRAEDYDPYKVIKKAELTYFWKATNDSITIYRSALRQEKSKSAQQEKALLALTKERDEAITLLNVANQQSDSISFLGIRANKFVYLSVLWILFLGTLVGAGLVFYLYKNSLGTTLQKIAACEKVTQEFNEYKQVKFEVEKKLKRELQTQINTIEELKRGG